MASTISAPGDLDSLNDVAMFQIRSSVEFYYKSIHENMPAFYLPKEIVDSMGAGRLARVANNYANEVRTDVSIAYDPAFSLFKIAPPEYMGSSETLMYLDTVIYQNGTIMPLRKWELMIPNSSDLASNFGQTTLVEIGPGNRKISKPPNCFILFRRDHRQLVQERYPDATLGEISSIIAQMWAVVGKKVKSQYQSEALKLKRQHENDHPNWRCQPRKSSDIKKRAVKKSTLASSPVLARYDHDRINIRLAIELFRKASVYQMGQTACDNLYNSSVAFLLRLIASLPEGDRRD
ncbi:hypothetical protein V493_05378 [Pseudogymnoascus sp. VKM F-4281 (FW-2241)]|nr:hypothetical protein V493_05378 [Pseudogymnoascus sp. VKM F-4281 (FW-2241)]